MTRHDGAMILLPALFAFSLGCRGGDSAEGPRIRSPTHWLYPDVDLWCRHDFALPGPASAEACDALSPEDLVDAPQRCSSRDHGVLDVQIEVGMGRFYFDEDVLVAVWPTTDVHPGGWSPPYWYGDVVYCENAESLGQPW